MRYRSPWSRRRISPQQPPQVRGNSAVFDVFVGPNNYRVFQLEEAEK
jgi:hypothetical protein